MHHERNEKEVFFSLSKEPDAMDLLLVFIVTLILITAVSTWCRISPFFTLILGAIFFGLLAGMGLDATIREIATGAGRVFATFCIIIFSGAVIATFLQEQNQAGEIVSDIRRIVKNPPALAGFSGWLLAVPLACCVTAYVMLVPILRCLAGEGRDRCLLLCLAAVGSVLSFSLIYPSPAVIPLYRAFSAGTSAFLYNAIAIPLSLVVLAGVILSGYRNFRASSGDTGGSGSCPPREPAAIIDKDSKSIHWRAWAPFIAIVAAIPVTFLVLGLSHAGSINIVMLTGAVTTIALAPAGIRSGTVTKGAKHAGVIIFDICGAGALGYVIVSSGFAGQALLGMTSFLPVILVPFIIAALLATAQGSRVTTAVITSEVLAGSVIIGQVHPIPLILLIAAGSCIVSYVTDPYFWLVQRTTGADMGTVVQYYTLPIALAGVAIFMVAAALEYLVFFG